MPERPNWITSEWTLWPSKEALRPITIHRMWQRDDSVLFAVRHGGYCLNRHGAWEYEPIPSSRDDAFMARCRFETFEAARAAAMQTEEATDA